MWYVKVGQNYDNIFIRIFRMTVEILNSHQREQLWQAPMIQLV